MLLEVDGSGSAEVEVEELGGGQVVEVAVVEAEIGLGDLVVLAGDGVQIGEVRRHVGRPAAREVGHARRVVQLQCWVRRRLAGQSASWVDCAGNEAVVVALSSGAGGAIGGSGRHTQKRA